MIDNDNFAPPYDDEELINDDYEEDGYFPEEEYDEAFMEEMAGDGAKGGGAVTAANAIPTDDDAALADNQEKEKHVSNANIFDDFPFDGKNDDLDGDGGGEVPSQVFIRSEPVKPMKKQIDLYSFDRYNGGTEWRQTVMERQKAESDVMTAVRWKNSVAGSGNDNHNGNVRSNRSGASAPEAQLVKLSSRSKNAELERSERFLIANRLPVEDEDSIPITLGNGRRLHIRHARELQFVRNNQLDPTTSNPRNEGLLGIPLKELSRRADAIERKKERKKRLKLVDDLDSVHDEITSEEPSDSTPNSSKTRYTEMDRLWIDKHAPAHFSDLLSDERINREVLRALRQWDPYVFKKAPPARPLTYHPNGGNGREQEEKKSDEEENKDTRPDENNRVILLSGPPGIGKTTLAHIIARHAGYRPIEVNASDERSAAVLTDRVTRAMESVTLNFEKDDMAGRPNCLILDEIDGADAKSSIMALVNIIRAEKPAAGSKPKDKKTYLRRPIIFICNHKHAPALRPLLPYAREFDVLAPSSNRLVSRLKGVLASERMTLVGGSSMLHKLVEGASGDIRSCLYTLQFAAAKARESAGFKRHHAKLSGSQSKLVDISSSLRTALGENGNGLKDDRGDMSGTLMTIFRKLKSRAAGNSSASRRDVERVLGSVETFGDNSKTLDSLFLNIMRVSYVDPTLDRCWTAHEWLSTSDIFRSMKTSVASNNMAEHRTMQKWHIPSAAAAVHLLCRVETRPDLTLSLRALNDTIYQLEANSGLVDKFLEGLSPLAKSGINKSHFVSDVLPYCLWLLSAGSGNGSLTRPVSTVDILTKEEKIAFDAHVKLLTALGLTYVKDSDDISDQINPSRALKMRLEPEIDKISSYGDMKKSRMDVPPLMKELLAHATTLAGMRKNDETLKDAEISNKRESGKEKELEPVMVEAKNKNVGTNQRLDDKTKMKEDIGKTKVHKKKTTIKTNFLGIGAAKAKAARNARKAALVSGSKSKVKLSNVGTGVPLDQVIRFKYQKGFTQAVRLPCVKSDLFL